MNSLTPIAGRPSASFCFGRDEICNHIIKSARLSKAVLLFGGRQAGKTTILLRTAQVLNSKSTDSPEYEEFHLGVYIDPMSLRFDAGPADFYRLLANSASHVCEQVLGTLSDRELPSARYPTDSSLDLLVDDLTAILNASRPNRICFIFLVDEAKRILGTRFPRGFLDNLFSLLYGSDFAISEKIALVFAGAQDLYEFFIDETSPLGGRADTVLCRNLDPEATMQIATSFIRPDGSCIDNSLLTNLYIDTGGHPGLTLKFTVELLSFSRLESANYSLAREATVQNCDELLRLWMQSLSFEARAIQNILLKEEEIVYGDAVKILASKSLDYWKVDRAIKELIFVGIAEATDRGCRRCNRIYWDYYAKICPDLNEPDAPDKINLLVRDAELSLRGLIRIRYNAAWPNALETRVKKVIGEVAWKRVGQIRAKSLLNYPYAQKSQARELLSCLYIGQLVDLMLHADAWPHFRHMFKDKRQLEDLRGSIAPVRNDIAHFVSIPPKEIQRCSIACDDLLFIIDKELSLNQRD